MSKVTETAHIAPKGAPISDKILLPGDPLRAKFIAEKYLDDTVQFNSVRNMLGYTGNWNGQQVSVMGTGMGIPSHALYVWELIHYFGVKKMIRIGSIGSLQEDVKLYDLVIAQAVSTDSNFLAQYDMPGQWAPTGSYNLIRKAVDAAEKIGATAHVGPVVSSDIYYHANPEADAKWAKMGLLGIEMETLGLYATAAEACVEALGMYTVSDHIITGEETSPEERQRSFNEMVETALATLVD